MRKAAVPKIEFEYEDSKENEEIVQNMYNKIFDAARRKVLEKRELNKETGKPDKAKLPLTKLDNTESSGVNY